MKRHPEIYTPQFLAWFGNWPAARAVAGGDTSHPAWKNVSKVVDKEGYPLVVWHGTDAEFYEFAPPDGSFSHFGTRLQARSAARTKTSGWEERSAEEKRKTQRLMPVYLRVLRPLRVADPLSNYPWDWDRVTAVPLHRRCDPQADALSRLFFYAPYEVRRIQNDERALWQRLRERIYAAGFDGLIYNNRFEGGGRGISWAILDPRQAKLALGGNSGAFSPAEPDIRENPPPPGRYGPGYERYLKRGGRAAALSHWAERAPEVEEAISAFTEASPEEFEWLPEGKEGPDLRVGDALFEVKSAKTWHVATDPYRKHGLRRSYFNLQIPQYIEDTAEGPVWAGADFFVFVLTESSPDEEEERAVLGVKILAAGDLFGVSVRRGEGLSPPARRFFSRWRKMHHMPVPWNSPALFPQFSDRPPLPSMVEAGGIARSRATRRRGRPSR